MQTDLAGDSLPSSAEFPNPQCTTSTTAKQEASTLRPGLPRPSGVLHSLESLSGVSVFWKELERLLKS